jgi:hypothetical protein
VEPRGDSLADGRHGTDKYGKKGGFKFKGFTRRTGQREREIIYICRERE